MIFIILDFTFQGALIENISEIQKEDIRKEIEYTSNNSFNHLKKCNVTREKNQNVHFSSIIK